VTPRASRRGGAVRVTGRLVRPARLTATLRPVRPAAMTAQTGPARSFARVAVGAPVRRAARAGARGNGFELRLRARGLRPGSYLLELRAGEPGTDLGRLRVTRTVRVE
jgi:hypothetical protein